MNMRYIPGMDNAIFPCGITDNLFTINNMLWVNNSVGSKNADPKIGNNESAPPSIMSGTNGNNKILAGNEMMLNVLK